MDIYKNSFDEKEDQMLWELHEIRHKLHERRKNKTLEEINRNALKRYAEWQEERQKNSMMVSS